MSEWSDVWEMEDFSNAYRNWLVEEMGARNYGILFDLLYDTEFVWDDRKMPRDADRAADGRYLRLRFANDLHSARDIPDECLGWPCSFLEFLVGLAFSIDDKIMYDPDTGMEPKDWFWMMMRNCGLDVYEDPRMVADGILAYYEVSEIADKVMFRRYGYDGSGGLFPLESPEMDQRKVETWYQANAYFIEKYFEEDL